MRRRLKFSLLMVAFLTALVLWTLPLWASDGKIAFESGDTIQEIRDKIEQNGYAFSVDHNRVFDMGQEERSLFFRRRPSVPTEISLDKCAESTPDSLRMWQTNLPEALDWRSYEGRAYIGPIRDQGYCGSCYSFGAAATAEGAYNLAKNLYDENCADFSEAYIAWCLGDLPEYFPHFYGCDGSDYDYMELEALTSEGVADESDFPYDDEYTAWLLVLRRHHRFPFLASHPLRGYRSHQTGHLELRGH